MKILLANDDGYRAEGLRFLKDALTGVAPLTVVAPDRNCSGASHSLTLEVPLRVQRVDEDTWYVINGTPTDCVHLAITGLFDFEFDMVVSGVNDGANLGDDVLYSGTVAAAIEGRFLGLPTVAVSLVAQGGTRAAFRDRRARRARDRAPPPRETPAPFDDPERQCAGPALRVARGIRGDAARAPPPRQGRGAWARTRAGARSTGWAPQGPGRMRGPARISTRLRTASCR